MKGHSSARAQIVAPVLGPPSSRNQQVVDVLERLGVNLAGPQRGFFESANAQLLGTVGCTATVEVGRERMLATYGAIRQMVPDEGTLCAIREFLAMECQGASWGWSDPTTALCLGFWLQALGMLGYDIRPVLVVDAPEHCSSSALWLAYAELLTGTLEPASTLVVPIEDLLDPKGAAASLARIVDHLDMQDFNLSAALQVVTERTPDRLRIAPASFKIAPLYRSLLAAGGLGRRTEEVTIWVVSPFGYAHSRVFDEIALALRDGLMGLGVEAAITYYPWGLCDKTIILGSQLLAAVPPVELPPDAILYNLELVDPESPWITPEYLKLLGAHQVWDFRQDNVQALRALGIHGVRICPIGYVPSLTRIAPRTEDIDVLFYGSLNERRQRVFEELADHGVQLVVLNGVYGTERDDYIARAKLILNVHFYERNELEIVRISYLLANQKCVVSETSCNPAVDEPFQGGIGFCSYEDIVPTCLRFLSDARLRERVAGRGQTVFESMRQRDFLAGTGLWTTREDPSHR